MIVRQQPSNTPVADVGAAMIHKPNCIRPLRLQLLLLCLMLTIAFGQVGVSEEPEETIEQIYARWVKQYEGLSEPLKADPLYLDLLGQDDGDLYFLRGLSAVPDPVRRLSRQALGQLKTSRAFEKLEIQANDKNMYVRQSAVQVLGDYRQLRCLPILLKVLQADREPQVRRQAATSLVNLPLPSVKAALLAAFNKDRTTSSETALTLSTQQVVEAIEPTYQLFLATKDGHTQEVMLSALELQNHKQAVRRMLDCQDHLVPANSASNSRMHSTIQLYFLRLSHKLRQFDVLPETPEQCRDWWATNEALFGDDLRPLPIANPDDLRPDLFNIDAEQLTFSITVDAKTYRVGDPIAVDFSLKNKSDRPTRTIPPVTSGWWPTMAYGVRLTRLGDLEDTLIAMEPSNLYVGSYSGPPQFETLKAGQDFIRRDCLQNWLRWQHRKLWPLAEGSYRLTIIFDNARFAGARAKPGETLHRWESPPVEFAIDGPPRTDPQELLKLVGEKSKMKWLEADLDSQTFGRSKAAWQALRVWGDDRLKPVLRDRKSYDQYIQERRPLSHFEFDPAKPSQ